MQIYTRIKDLVKGRKNFAYFCRFDDSGTNGREFLFLSDKPGISIFDRNFNEIDPLLNSENQIPAIITYDFVDSIYPSIGIKRSV
ncbi:MAG: hypothetical protein M1431_02240 [Candidatus Thermoplasmatota archaeon]|nr:hypothetical protein [Candidatus Thermoplasmatota archaeon]